MKFQSSSWLLEWVAFISSSVMFNLVRVVFKYEAAGFEIWICLILNNQTEEATAVCYAWDIYTQW